MSEPDPYRPPGPDTPAPHRPAPKPPRPQRPQRNSRQEGLLALLLAIGGLLIATALPAAGVVIMAFALVRAVRSIRASRQQPVQTAQGMTLVRGRAPGTAIVALVLGVFGCLAGLLMVVVMAVFNTELNAYQKCMEGANTILAKESCEQELLGKLQRRFNMKPTAPGTVSALG